MVEGLVGNTAFENYLLRENILVVNDYTISEIKEKYNEICIWGTGKKGTGNGYRCLKYVGIQPDYFCDNDKRKWGTRIIDDIICISPMTLQTIKKVFVFIFAADETCTEIEKQLNEMGIHNYLCSWELEESDYVVDCFLNSLDKDKICRNVRIPSVDYNVAHISNSRYKKLAIYTSIFGDYDNLLNPKDINSEADYFVISDKKPNIESVWKWIDGKKIVPYYVVDEAKKNRFCKTHACELFEEYDKSIYIDGNFNIKKDISFYADRVGRAGIAMFRMPIQWRDCVFVEGMSVADRLEDKDVILWQLKKYREEGMPRHVGMFEGGVIVRDHQFAHMRKMMREWWKEIYENSYRDQVSFMYVMWKNGFTKDDVGCLGENCRNVAELELINHQQEYLFTRKQKWEG